MKKKTKKKFLTLMPLKPQNKGQPVCLVIPVNGMATAFATRQTSIVGLWLLQVIVETVSRVC